MSDANKGVAGKKENRSGGGLWPLFVGLPLIVAVAVAAVLLSGGESSESGGGGEPPEAAQRAASEGATAESGSGPGTPTLGSEDAPVVMIEYGDFQ